MDKTQTYIKKADCEEIQSIWHSKELTPDKRHHDIRGLSRHYSKGYEGSWVAQKNHCSGAEYITLVDYEYETEYEKTDIWLPRQDELQEMIDWKLYEIRFDMFLAPIMSFRISGADAKSGNYVEGLSMEQLWLAFVMWELHKKKWNGEEWQTLSG